MTTMTFPEGKRFAFSIFDDTDVATLNSIRPLYDLFTDLNLKTTKTVWSLDFDGKSSFLGSDTLQNATYAAYMQELARRGFEIGFHGASMESSIRLHVERSLDIYRETFGEPPSIYAAHSHNRDNLYWGAARFSSRLWRAIYTRLNKEPADYFQGHDYKSPYFWGDLAKQHIKHMRSFTFSDVNLLNLKQPLVYKSAATPWINRWFLTCDADNVEEFNALLNPKNQEKLESEGGICIISTHLGKGFVDKNGVNPKTKHLLTQLSRRNGWFAPVSDILNHYVDQKGLCQISKWRLFLLEAQWLLDSVRRRLNAKDYTATETEFLLENLQTQARISTTTAPAKGQTEKTPT